jgi:hypothetical protein
MPIRRSSACTEGQFTPDGMSDQEVSRLFQGTYEDGLKALATGFASKKK